ncbi:MAG: hypothetical protein RJB38_1306 [Pseudomonadota bacterium]
MISTTQKLRQLRTDHTDEVDSEGSWAISYGDMVTLLLCFFILFFNVNQKSSEKTQKIQAALLTELGAKSNDSGNDSGKKNLWLNIGPNVGSQAFDEQTIKAWGGVPHQLGDRVLIEFPNISFFDFSSTKVTKEGHAALKKFVSRYVRYAGSNNLVIKAFTDNTKVDQQKSLRLARPFSDNLELSALRAVATMRSLQRSGVPLNRMRISGNGELEGQIRKVASSKNEKWGARQKGNPLSRKVILMIEPVTVEKKE